MKIQVTKEYLRKILQYYSDILTEKFLYEALTPVTRHYMNNELQSAINLKKMQETHKAWHIPLKIVFHPNQTVTVEVEDQSSVDIT